MVLISRKEEDTIQIGCDVSVTVIQASNGEVLLGVEAPDGTRILPAELAEPQAAEPLKIARTSPLEKQELSLLLFPTDAERQLRKVT